MSALDLRPLSIGEILDRSFTIYRRHFLLFFGLTAIPHLLSLALGLVQVLYLQRWTISAGGGQPRPISIYGSGLSVSMSLLAALVGLAVYVFTQGGATQAVSDLYLGRQTSILAALKRVADDVLTLLGVVLLNGIVIGLGFLLLIIPGIYFSCRLLVCLPVALVEGRGPRDSLSRSWQLTSDYVVRGFLLFALYIALTFALGGFLGAPIGVAIAATRFDTHLLPGLLALQQIASTLTNVLVSPLFLIGSCVFYYDLRVRKEAFDLQFMMDPTSERKAQGGDSVPSIL